MIIKIIKRYSNLRWNGEIVFMGVGEEMLGLGETLEKGREKLGIF